MPYGLLYFYESGTNDDKTTFADVNEQFPNTQPLILNGDGSVPNCFYSGSAKVILITNAGTKDVPIDGEQQWERDPVTSASIGAIGRVWDAVSIYDKDSVVIHDSIYYVSIINSNQNNNPSSTPTAWSQFDLLVRWNTNETYQLGDPVTASDGFLYTSLITDNTGNDPTSTTGFWTLPLVLTPNHENAIINGGPDFFQRGTTTSAPNTYRADRWKTDFLATSERSDTVVGDSLGAYTLRVDGDGAQDPAIATTIELPAAGVVGQFQGIWTLSFWANNIVGNQFSILTAWNDSVDGTGGNRVIIDDTSIANTPNTANFYTLSMDMDSVSPAAGSNCISIRITGNGAASSNFRLSAVKFESGSLATPFTRAGNTIPGEYTDCRRYFRVSDVNTRVDEYSHEMRITPILGGADPYTYDAEF